MKALSSIHTTKLEADVVDGEGNVIARKGEVLIILPQTVAAAVVVGNGKSLVDFIRETQAKLEELAAKIEALATGVAN